MRLAESNMHHPVHPATAEFVLMKIRQCGVSDCLTYAQIAEMCYLSEPHTKRVLRFLVDIDKLKMLGGRRGVPYHYLVING